MKKCEQCEAELSKNGKELICKNCGAVYAKDPRDVDGWTLVGWQTQEEDAT